MRPARKFTQRDSRAAGRYYAAMAGKEPMPMDLEPAARLPRKKSAVVNTQPKESEILHDIMKLLKLHPKVGKVWRQNSGTFAMEYGSKTHYVRANTARGMADIQGILKGGRSFFIEVKRPGAKLMDHQADFLIECNKMGALAFCAWSVDDVLLQLEDL